MLTFDHNHPPHYMLNGFPTKAFRKSTPVGSKYKRNVYQRITYHNHILRSCLKSFCQMMALFQNSCKFVTQYNLKAINMVNIKSVKNHTSRSACKQKIM